MFFRESHGWVPFASSTSSPAAAAIYFTLDFRVSERVRMAHYLQHCSLSTCFVALSLHSTVGYTFQLESFLNCFDLFWTTTVLSCHRIKLKQSAVNNIRPIPRFMCQDRGKGGQDNVGTNISYCSVRDKTNVKRMYVYRPIRKTVGRFEHLCDMFVFN